MKTVKISLQTTELNKEEEITISGGSEASDSLAYWFGYALSFMASNYAKSNNWDRGPRQ